MAYLSLSDIRIEYEKHRPILDGFQLTIEEGELVSLLGPSGCGKTTTLRTVAGFIEPVAGTVVIAGRDVTRLPPHKRDIGIVFQSYALFPHLTVFQNVAFGLQRRRVPKDQIAQRVMDALALVDMTNYADRRPAQLSGGQRQRVAVARAVVIEPTLLLMDEPLSNLDAKLRVGMRTEIRRLQQRLGTTTLYVTHDHVEALTLSDRIVVMNAGQIEQIGTPEEIFGRPRTPFVADFMGFENSFAAQIEAVHEDGAVTLAVTGETWQVAPLAMGVRDLRNGPVSIYFRPEGALLGADARQNSLLGTISLRTFRGSTIEYVVDTPVGEFIVYDDGDHSYAEGDNAYLSVPPQKLVIMPHRDDYP